MHLQVEPLSPSLGFLGQIRDPLKPSAAEENTSAKLVASLKIYAFRIARQG